MDQAAAERTGTGSDPEGQGDGLQEDAALPAQPNRPQDASEGSFGRPDGHGGSRPIPDYDDERYAAAQRHAEADSTSVGSGGADADEFIDGESDGDPEYTGPRRRSALPRPEEPRPKATGFRVLLVPFAAAWRFAFPKKPRPFIVELPFLLAIALVLAFLIKTFLVQAFVIPSGSMQNTLAINDRVLVNRLADWTGAKPNRGDIVVFQDPGGWLDNEPAKPKNVVSKALTFVGLLPEDNGDLIKRVIGVPGDHVSCAGSGSPVFVNGVALNEPYLYPGNSPSDEPFDVTVPAGHLWVMGDHRALSADSRPHEAEHPGGGMVPIKNVVGHAVLIVWPFSHFGTLPRPATFKQKALSSLAAPGVAPAAFLSFALPISFIRRRRGRVHAASGV